MPCLPLQLSLYQSQALFQAPGPFRSKHGQKRSLCTEHGGYREALEPEVGDAWWAQWCPAGARRGPKDLSWSLSPAREPQPVRLWESPGRDNTLPKVTCSPWDPLTGCVEGTNARPPGPSPVSNLPSPHEAGCPLHRGSPAELSLKAPANPSSSQRELSAQGPPSQLCPRGKSLASLHLSFLICRVGIIRWL